MELKNVSKHVKWIFFQIAELITEKSAAEKQVEDLKSQLSDTTEKLEVQVWDLYQIFLLQKGLTLSVNFTYRFLNIYVPAIGNQGI